MFSGIDIGGNDEPQVSGCHEGSHQPLYPPSGEPVPFEFRLMSKRELAGYFGITERTVEVWMRRRYIPYIKIGQTVRFRVATVLRYVDDKYLVPAGEARRRARQRMHSQPGNGARSGGDAARLHNGPDEAATGSAAGSGN
jgi:excisionase family DNA binding protein